LFSLHQRQKLFLKLREELVDPLPSNLGVDARLLLSVVVRVEPSCPHGVV
jgi:hypothetical protein